ncbi:MAG: Rpn family recombination-promoting nuclease/putative transposase [Thermoflexaceae bacterium]|nr:Rpn family recombination-promoting nuclease/putative transposase [Thermoflexaceae bacterium]
MPKKKKLSELNLTDKFLFDETTEDPAAYEALVSVLLENDTHFLTRPETEKEYRLSPELRQIRLDVIAMDENDELYYTEMQQKNTGNLIKRSRYYQAQIDVSLLEPGVRNFNRLNDSCMILIAPFDLFGRGLYRYTFEGTCRECPDLKLNDGSKRVFINLHGKNCDDFSDEFLEMMEYLEHTTDSVAQKVHSKRIKLIHDKVNKIKLSEQMGVKYMQHWEELAEAKDEGRSQGELLTLISLIVRKLKKNKSVESIADELEQDVEYVRHICEITAKFAPDYDCESIMEEIIKEK